MAKLGRNLITQNPNANIVYKRREKRNPSANGEQESDFRDQLMSNPAKYQEAILYAKGEMEDPGSKEYYQENTEIEEDAYKVALADFYNAPSIDEVDLSGYKGKVGDKIIVRAVDDFAVDTVYIAIYNDDGSKLEEGYALLATNNIDWIYTATKDNSLLKHDKIIIRATDRPGNIVEKEEELK